MLACNKLRIDPPDGPVMEYRVEDDGVECRVLDRTPEGSTEKQWRHLSSEQLGSHVMANTIVAQWLRRRMGLRRLIRACNQSPSFANETPDSAYPRAA